MSSLYVRDKVKTWADALTTPFYNTVNIEQDPLEDTWLTVQWQFADIQETTFCYKTEAGLFTLLWFGVSGVEDDALLSIAETEIKLFMANTDVNMQLIRSHAPYNFVTVDNVPKFCISIDIDYTYNEV